MAGRAGFSGRIGFVFAAVGSAVGLGNLWGFPYRVSESGGGAFVLVYLLLLLVIGVPALASELAIGRSSGTGAGSAFKGRSKVFGYVGIGAAVLLLSYYSVIAGWSLHLLGKSIFGSLGDPNDAFLGYARGEGAIFTHFLFMLITAFVVVRGVSGGIEKSNLIMMPFLFLFIIGLAVYGNLQDGAGAGRSFYLGTDFGKLTHGDISAAASQTFFSIGLGLGTMLTYASYLDRKSNMQNLGLTIAFADTGVALLAGFMVFPLLFSLGLNGLATSGSSIGGLFIVIPTAFQEIGGGLGTALAIGFFLALAFAALSSAISLLEVPVAALVDRGMDRKRASIICTASIYVLGILPAISLTFLDVYDIILNHFVLILGGLLFTLYSGWIAPRTLDELSKNLGRLRLDKALRFMIRFPLPVLLAVLFVVGVIEGVEKLAAL